MASQSEDCPQPELTPTQREIVKPYGGWTEFLACFNLSTMDEGDVEEGKNILRALAAEEENKENIIAEVLRERAQ